MTVASANRVLEPPPLPHDRSSETSASGFSVQLFGTALFLLSLLQFWHPAWFVNVLRVLHAGPAVTAVTLFLATALSVLVHELGHLSVSLACGFHVSRVSLGPISVSRAHDRWKLQYSRAWLSASVSALPPDERAWRTRMLLVVAGGPIATLCLFIAALYFLNESSPLPRGAEFLAALVEINLLLFAVGLIPNPRNSSVRNDARLFLTILHNYKEAEQINLYQKVTWLQVSGERPRAYPSELIKRLAHSEGNYDLMLFAALSVFLWALDRGEIALADRWDQHATALLALRPLRLANCVLAESACFDFFFRNLPDSALSKLSTVRLETLPPTLQKRAKSTLQAAQGNWSEAIHTIEVASGELSPDLPGNRFESELLGFMKHRAIITSSLLSACAVGA